MRNDLASRLQSRLLQILLVAGGASGCQDIWPVDIGENVKVTMRVVGEGRIYYEHDGEREACSNSVSSCDTGFNDAGGGGVFDVIAEADPGWKIGAWDEDCAGTVGGVCTLSFEESPGTAYFFVTITFVEVSATPTGENLLVDPGFETLDYHTGMSPVIPNATGYWQGDLGAIVSGLQTDGVAPDEGTHMLCCDASGPYGPGRPGLGDRHRVLCLSVRPGRRTVDCADRTRRRA